MQLHEVSKTPQVIDLRGFLLPVCLTRLQVSSNESGYDGGYDFSVLDKKAGTEVFSGKSYVE